MIANPWLAGEADARSQSHEIEWIGDRSCFIEVVDAPDQSAFVVPPSTKIFEVGVAHREHRWRLCKIREQRLDPLRPAKKRCAQEGKCVTRHQIAFIFKIRFHHLASIEQAPLAQPILECGVVPPSNVIKSSRILGHDETLGS